ncbi:unnamed protein product [Phytophthora fragariaefolia]|uniref:Unnamed protein product n=1 Tax=Phytophthora fragariaefolia TaxID=1490495 RepID=A0A9W6Y9L6_9STRA|nr:unnamed protein product [Phytophthora fragariaefolia]
MAVSPSSIHPPLPFRSTTAISSPLAHRVDLPFEISDEVDVDLSAWLVNFSLVPRVRMAATDAEESWDEWEEAATASPPQAPAAHSLGDHEAKTQALPVTPNSPLSDAGKWGFDLSELEREMSGLPPTSYATPFIAPDAASSSEDALLSALDGLPSALQAGGERLRTLQALALVARLHVESARSSFAELQSGSQSLPEVLGALAEELQQLAGEWGDRKLLETTLSSSERLHLEEMTGLLHNALDAENEDLTLFQEVVEQLFDGLHDHKLVVSTNWLQSGKTAVAETEESYLKQVLAISSDEPGNSSRMPTLSEAEIFQDAKDIGRDELLINGQRVEGTRGYDAVVDALQHELEHVLAHQAGKTPEQTPMAVSNALQSVAMAVLHASNRTESGGSSYELLGKFLSNHDMGRVLLRPASARAAPLEVHMDVGPYVEAVPGSREPIWAFGLRVKLVAVTWYLVCDSEDPTSELYEIETTFCNRLAFPVGLTPFHPLDSMRKDRGHVTVRLVLPAPGTAVAAPTTVAGGAVGAAVVGSGRSVVLTGPGVEKSPTSGTSIDPDMDVEPPAVDDASSDGRPTSSELEPESLSEPAEAEALELLVVVVFFVDLVEGVLVEGFLVTSATSADADDEEEDFLCTNTDSSLLSESSPADVLFLVLEFDLLESVSPALVSSVLELDDCVAVRVTRFERIVFAFCSAFCEEESFDWKTRLGVLVLVIGLVTGFATGAVVVVLAVLVVVLATLFTTGAAVFTTVDAVLDTVFTVEPAVLDTFFEAGAAVFTTVDAVFDTVFTVEPAVLDTFFEAGAAVFTTVDAVFDTVFTVEPAVLDTFFEAGAAVFTTVDAVFDTVFTVEPAVLDTFFEAGAAVFTTVDAVFDTVFTVEPAVLDTFFEAGAAVFTTVDAVFDTVFTVEPAVLDTFFEAGAAVFTTVDAVFDTVFTVEPAVLDTFFEAGAAVFTTVDAVFDTVFTVEPAVLDTFFEAGAAVFTTVDAVFDTVFTVEPAVLDTFFEAGAAVFTTVDAVA